MQLLAQVSSQIPPLTPAQAAVHLNSLYEEWGLLAGVLGVSVPLIGLIWWLMNLNEEETTAARLKIRSRLVSLFQSTVADEALRLFDLVDQHLPYSLSQANSRNARPSAFDRLSQGLAKLDLQEPAREEYREIIEQALSGMIIGEVKKLLRTAKTPAMSVEQGLSNPTGLFFSFEAETERTLNSIARQTGELGKRERGLDRHKRWAFYALVTSVIAGVLSTPFYFLDIGWAYRCCAAFILIFAVGAIIGLLCIARMHYCKTWIAQTAAKEVAAGVSSSSTPQRKDSIGG